MVPKHINYNDIKLSGMSDPFGNKFKSVIKDYRGSSDYACKYETWSLRSIMSKANDDLRQEVLAI